MLGRIIVGLAVGLASMVVPMYISEISPRYSRGKLVTVNVIMVTGGQVIALVICLGRGKKSVSKSIVNHLITCKSTTAGILSVLLMSTHKTVGGGCSVYLHCQLYSN